MTTETLTLKLLKIRFNSYSCELETMLKNSELDLPKIQGTFKLLSRINDEFEEEYNKLVHKLITDNTDQTEITSLLKDFDEATIRFNSLAYSVEKVMNSKIEKTSSVSSTKSKLNLPKIDFRKFGGEIKDWLQFWSLFKRIHEDEDMEDEDKFQYLLQATTPNSKARRLIESYPPTGENYSKAIENLKTRFGRDDLLIEYYVRELLKLVLNNLHSKTHHLSHLYDKMEAQLRSLGTLGVTSDACSAMLYPLLESCLPEEVLRAWQRSGEFSTTDPLKKRLDNLMLFLRREVENEERIMLASSFETQKKKEVEYKNVPSASGLLNQNVRCGFCKNQHYSDQCQQAMKMTLQERKEKLRHNGCCFRCLRQGHLGKKCTMFAKLKCKKCGGKHVPVMCDENETNSRSTIPQNLHVNLEAYQTALRSTVPQHLSEPAERLIETNQVTTGMTNQSTHDFLQTLAVNVVCQGRTKTIRALIDTGSQKSYILRKTADEMQLKVIREEDMVHALFGGYHTETIRHKCYKTELTSVDKDYSCFLETYDQNVICGNIVSIYDGPWCREITDLNVTVSDTKEGPIELLLGSDVAGKLYTGRRHELSCGLVLMEIKLGWTLMGKTFSTIPRSSCMVISSMLCTEKLVSDLWNLELMGINDPVKESTKVETEKLALEHFSATVKRTSESRYEVNLPWTENHPPLPTNFHVATKRLDSLIRKLEKDGYRNDYNEVLSEWLIEGIIEEVDAEDHEIEGHYLPHRHVVKLSSNTTKLRPVFDASAKENSKSSSLNQCLEKGKNFIELIPSILLRFRHHKYGVISDIRKAFLQISLNENDRNFLRFLWFTPENELKIYRHCRVVFGLTCSPFLLGAVIQHHLTKVLPESLNYSQDFLMNLSKSFYVDNSIISFDHEEEVKPFKKDAEKAMMEAQIDLRCWEFTGEKQCLEAPLSSVLGLKWNKFTDTLEVSLESFQNSSVTEKLTKKMILSLVNKIFDVIGFVSPALLIPKILLQITCKLKLTWNIEVPDFIKKKFFDWYQDVHYLSNIKIPRWIRPDVKEKCKQESLHLFCDASQDAYAAIIFLRIQTSDSTDIRLIQAKNRVEPIKTMSIPRLELLAATIGSRILNSVRKEFDANIAEYCWTDSSTVLSWIQRTETWKPFVKNRVIEI